MKLNKKRIIAREFLLFLSCVFISSLAFIGTYPYNYSINSKIGKLEKDVIPLATEIDSLEKILDVKLSKQKWFYKEWQNNNNLSDYKDYTVMWERLQYLHEKDSIEYKWNNVWAKTVLDFIRSVGFNNPNQFNKFINTNSFNKSDSKIVTKIKNVRVEVANLKNQINNNRYKILDIDEQVDFALLFLIITGIIAFPLRYLFYSVKWSIRTLKLKE